MARLSKFTQAEIAKAMTHPPEIAARCLAVIFRCGNTNEQREINDILLVNPNIKCRLKMVNGCWIPKEEI